MYYSGAKEKKAGQASRNDKQKGVPKLQTARVQSSQERNGNGAQTHRAEFPGKAPNFTPTTKPQPKGTRQPSEHRA